MFVLFALLLAFLLPILCVGPGFFFIRRLRWNSGPTLCASIGLSLILIYLAETTIYLLGLGRGWIWLGSVGGLVLTGLAGRDLWRFLHRRSVRRQLAGFGMLLVIGLLAAVLIRHFSGGPWSGDWIEHFERTRFFLDNKPMETMFIGIYSLPARPPMMNMVAAWFLAHTTGTFEYYQLIFLFLNLLVYFPCVWLSGMLIRGASRRPMVMAGFLSLSPVVIQNGTWTWTKLLAAFFVLLAVAMYLRAWRKNDPIRMIAAAVSMSAAILVHYSAGPYAVALAVNYGLIVGWRRRKTIEIGGGLLAGVLLLATWFAWSLAYYGSGTFTSNTAVADAGKISLAENLAKIAQNFLTTLVPHPLIKPPWEFRLWFDQPNPFGYLRDYFFVLYQTNLVMAWGLVGWLAVGWLMIRVWKQAAQSVRLFWGLFIAISLVLGVVTHGTAEAFGVSHVSLQPLVLVGLILLAGGFARLPRWGRVIILSVLAFDVCAGIILQVRMQTYAMALLEGPGATMVPLGDSLLNATAVQSSAARYQRSIPLLSDYIDAIGPMVYLLFVIALAWPLVMLARAVALRGAWIVVMGMYLIVALACSGDRMLGYDVNKLQRISVAGMTDQQVTDSVTPYIRAVSNEPYSSAARQKLGMVMYDLGQVPYSREVLIDAFLLDPHNLEARYALNILLATHGFALMSTPAAFADYYVFHPFDPRASAGLAEVLDARGLELAALERLREALQRQPDLPEAHSMLAKKGMTFRDLDRRIEELRSP